MPSFLVKAVLNGILPSVRSDQSLKRDMGAGRQSSYTSRGSRNRNARKTGLVRYIIASENYPMDTLARSRASAHVIARHTRSNAAAAMEVIVLLLPQEIVVRTGHHMMCWYLHASHVRHVAKGALT